MQKRERSERSEIRANLGTVPVLCADKFAPDYALAIDYICFRPHLRVIETGGLLRWVAHCDQIDMTANEKAVVGIGIFVHTDSEYDHVGKIMVQVKQRGHLLHAGAAPGRPEVQQHYAAAIVGQMYAGGAI